MDIHQVDPPDEDTLAEWQAVVERSQGIGRPWARPRRLPEVRAELRGPTSRHHVTAYAGRAGGAIVSAGSLTLSLVDNPRTAEIELDTDPDHRRSGHGSAMLSHLENVARADGRSLMNAEAHHPLSGPADGAGCANIDFLTRRGFRHGLGDVHRVLDLPVPGDLLDRLAAAAAPHHPAYRILALTDRVPEEHLASFAVIEASLMTEAPVGEVEREAELADPGLVREGERLREDQGREACTTLALDPTGEVVAFTTVVTTRHDPDTAFQWGTVVRRQHRGHRLGLAVKVANHRLLQEHAPQVRSVFTYNAEVNSHMGAVNAAVGYRPVERLGELQKRL